MLRYSIITGSRRRSSAIGLSQAATDCAIGVGVRVPVRGQSSSQQPQVDEESPVIVTATTTQITQTTPSGTSIPWRERMASLREAGSKNSNSTSQLNSKNDPDPLSTFFQKRSQLLSQSPQRQPETKTTSTTSSTGGADFSQWRTRLQQSTQRVTHGENSDNNSDNNSNNRQSFVSRTTRPKFQVWNSKAALPTTPDLNNNHNKSISDRIDNNEEDSSLSDMKDVSRLRAAMLRALAQKSKQGPTGPAPGSQEPTLRSSWRARTPTDDPDVHISGGAREWRKRLQQQERFAWEQQRLQEEHQREEQQRQQEQQQQELLERNAENESRSNERPNRPNVGAFFADKAVGPGFQKRQQERRDQESFHYERDINDKKVTLPPTKTLRESGEYPRDENHVVDIDTMEVVALDLGLEPTRSSRRAPKSLSEENRELLLQRRADEDTYDLDRANAEAHMAMPLRPPVVCLMGHVDHGKTTLMDALRRKKKRGVNASSGKKKKMKNKGEASNNATSDGVAGTEAGGITQAISAFQVSLENQENGAVTFLDTPGHAAFRSMRESGSHAADVIVLVVAADDGVSPQTIEIIDFFKSIYEESGGISLVVAMTKVDKPGIIIDESRYRIENELMEQGIVPESFASTTKGEFGPPVQIVPVSGLTGEGVDNLIEALVLQSEVMELRADPDAQAEGIILDARYEKGVGVVADCIIRWGSMKRGDVVLSGLHTGKVKALKDTSGGIAKKVLPSEPVRILGFKTLPKAGDPVVCVDSEEKAEKLIQRRAALGGVEGSVRTEDDGPSSLQIMGVAAQHRKLQFIHDKYNIDMHAVDSNIRIPVVLRADANGTLAALCDAIVAIGNESSLDVVIDPIGLGIGPISAADVKLATDSNAPIFSFNVKQNDKEALALLEENGVVMKSSKVIYTILDAAKEVFASYIPPTTVAHVHGKAVVKAVFEVNKSSERERIAGLRVTNGHLYLEKAPFEGKPVECHYRVIRGGEQISPKGEVVSAASMRKVKENVQEVRNGEECGLGLNGFKEFEEGDIIECYSVETKAVFL